MEVPPTTATPGLPDHAPLPSDTPLGTLEDSYSSTIHELMQHMLNTSGGVGQEGGVRTTSSWGRGQEGGARTTSREDSADHQLPREQLFTPACKCM